MIIFFTCSDLLECLRSVWTISIRTENVLKQHQSLINLHCKHPLSLFWCIPWMTTPEVSGSFENISNTARVSRLSFFWQCFHNGFYLVVVSAFYPCGSCDYLEKCSVDKNWLVPTWKKLLPKYDFKQIIEMYRNSYNNISWLFKGV